MIDKISEKLQKTHYPRSEINSQDEKITKPSGKIVTTDVTPAIRSCDRRQHSTEEKILTFPLR